MRERGATLLCLPEKGRRLVLFFGAFESALSASSVVDDSYAGGGEALGEGMGLTSAFTTCEKVL